MTDRTLTLGTKTIPTSNDYTDSDVEHLTLALVQQEQVLNECESLLKETISEDGVYADFDARLAAYWEKSKALADWRTRDMLIAESHQHKTGLAAQIDRARRQIEAWPADVRAAMGLPNTHETFEQPMLTVRSRGPLGPNDVIVDATELVKHVTFRMSLKIPADANAQKAGEQS